MTWSDLGEMIKIFGAIATGAAALTGAYVATRGLQKWHVETVGKRRTEVAEAVLVSFYEIQDVIASVRSPFSFEGEGETRKRGENESPEETRRKDIHFVQLERIHAHRELIAAFQARRYVARAVLGIDVDEAYADVLSVLNKVSTAAGMLMRTSDREQAGGDKKLWQDLRSDIWSVGTDADRLKTQVNKAVAKAEAICGPILEAR